MIEITESVLNSLMTSSILASYNQVLLGENDQSYANAVRRLSNMFSFPVIENHSFKQIDYKTIYRLMVENEVLFNASENLIEELSTKIPGFTNAASLQLDSLMTQVNELDDLYKILSLYAGNTSNSKYTFRLFPTLKTKSDSSSIPEHSLAIKDLEEAAIELKKGTLSSLSSALNKSQQAALRAVSDSDGKVSIALKNGFKEVFNTLKLDQSSSSVFKVENVHSENSNNLLISSLPSTPEKNVILHMAPDDGKDVVIDLIGSPNTEVILDTAKLMQIEYLEEGTIAEQEIKLFKPARFISIIEDSYLLPPELEEYFEVKHLVKWSEDIGWIEIKSRNRDSQRSDVPELIAFGRQVDSSIVGIRYFNTNNPIYSFHVKSTFKKIKSIPQNLMGSIRSSYTTWFHEEIPKSDLIDTSAQELTLTYPTIKPIYAAYKTKIPYSSSNKKHQLTANRNSYTMPEYIKLINSSRISVYKNNLQLTKASTSSSTNYSLNNDILEVSRNADDNIYISIMPDYSISKIGDDYIVKTYETIDLSRLKFFSFIDSEVLTKTILSSEIAMIGNGLYSINLGPISSITSITALLNSSDVSSNVFPTNVGKINDLLSLNTGEYGYYNDQLIIKPNTAYSITDYDITVKYIQKKQLELKDFLVKDYNQFQFNTLPVNNKKVTIPIGSDSYTINDTGIIQGSLYIQDYVFESKLKSVAKSATAKVATRSGGMAHFNLEGILDSNQDIEVTHQGSSINFSTTSTEVVVDENDISSDYINIEHSLYENVDASSSKAVYNSDTKTIRFLSTTTEELTLTYETVDFQIESYLSEPVSIERINNSTIRLPALTNELVISYQRSNSIGSSSYIRDSLISLIPRYVDVEVETV